jgi:N-acylglucosamine 2-epimerase
MNKQNTKINFSELAQKYKSELLDKVVPFWLNHSKDEEFGGYFTCLDRTGNVFDTDKFIWLQAREVWMFSSLYNNVEQKSEWLEMALHGAEFLKKHALDADGNWYFSLNRQGEPLVQPYNIFSDCFATMAFGQLFKATGNKEHAEIAKQTFQNILKKSDNPKGKYNKSFPGIRPLKGFSLPMILCNLSLEIEHLLEPELVKETIDNCIHEVMEVFYDESSGLIFENVNPDGSFSDSFEGRLLNPGHAIEAMWFIMDLADRLKNRGLMDKAVQILLKTLKYGWDEKYGGIFYFLDIKGFPPQQLEWDQKLWWVHIETLISLIKAYYFTGNEECLQWFEKVHNYTWSHFSDPEYPEWFGYLNRQGEVLLPLKGGKWKGCFHVPRGLFQVWKTLEKIN